jgi:hypothetical protein
MSNPFSADDSPRCSVCGENPGNVWWRCEVRYCVGCYTKALPELAEDPRPPREVTLVALGMDEEGEPCGPFVLAVDEGSPMSAEKEPDTTKVGRTQ